MTTNTTTEATEMTVEERLKAKMEQTLRDGREASLERQIDLLDTQVGVNEELNKYDTKVLEVIVKELSSIQDDKPVFNGYTYAHNVELIVAIASNLQYMKGTLRDEVPSEYYAIFNDDIRTELLGAYGQLPYVSKPLIVEIDGEEVTIERNTDSTEGVKSNVEVLTPLVNSIALKLGLLREYKCTQRQADLAWKRAVRKVEHEKELNTRYKGAIASR